VADEIESDDLTHTTAILFFVYLAYYLETTPGYARSHKDELWGMLVLDFLHA